MIPAGHLREEFLLLQKAEHRDSIGGVSETLEEVGETMGRFLPLDATSQFQAGQIDILEAGTVWLDASVYAVEVGMLVRRVEDGTTFEVSGMARYGRHLRLSCVRRKV